MAEALPFVEFAANKLFTFLREEGRLLGGLELEIQLISDEFGHMKAFLQKVSDADRDDHDPQLTEWIRQVREVSYETEDVFDKFMYHFGRHRAEGFRGYAQQSFNSIKKLPARHRLASKLKDIKARIKNISEARLRYEPLYANILPRIGNVSQENAWRHRKDDDALLAEESQLVGISGPKNHLISKILDAGHPQLKVIAVLGMGGLGKTTLVKRVYDDAAVNNHFQIRAWVTVSQTCDYQGLLQDLIQQVLRQFKEAVPPMSDVLQLKEVLKDILKRGRYLIVFDDVWDAQFLDGFKYVFPENVYGGNRVILTTRKADVASASKIESHVYVYEMGFLNSDDSWTLFCRKTFEDKICPTHLKDVAESIVGKCNGLPLAIVAIGGLLASKDTNRINEWERVRHGLRHEFEGAGKFDRVKKIFSLSFNDLSSTLKACLLYISTFPEDYQIVCRHVIQLWVAERFVEPRQGQTAEEVGWDFLEQLARRSLIQFHEVRYNGSYEYFTVHDLLREFLATKARDQNIGTLLTQEMMETEWFAGTKIRRLVFHLNLSKMIIDPRSQHSISNIRSIVNFGIKNSPPKAVLTKLLTSRLLTVVDLRGMELEEFPKQVFKLFNLKILALEGVKIETIPKAIERLQNLECLWLINVNVKELPMEIQKLHKLRGIVILQPVTDPYDAFSYKGIIAPPGLGELVDLQVLKFIDVSDNKKSGIVNEIGKLTKLRHLCITDLRTEDGNELCSSLEKLNNLELLAIYALHERDEVNILDLSHPISIWSLQSLFMLLLIGPLEKLPTWIRNLQRLEIIYLKLSNLKEDSLESLQHLPNLSEIELDAAYLGESMCFKSGCFLKLKSLSLWRMKELKRVKVEKDAMPNLSKLVLNELPLLEELPFGMENLRKLQELHLQNMNSKLTNKLENEQDSEGAKSEEIKKILHVPHVVIWFHDKRDGKWKSHKLQRK